MKASSLSATASSRGLLAARPGRLARCRIQVGKETRAGEGAHQQRALERAPTVFATGTASIGLKLNPHSTTSIQAAAAEVVAPSKELVLPKYCESTHQTRRRPTRTINVSLVVVVCDLSG